MNRQGFTLVELMVSLAIIGILIATTVPLANTYRMRAKYLELKLTLGYLMDGWETYYIETNDFYPKATSSFISIVTVTVNAGEEKYIPELKYTFPKGHSHQYKFRRLKFPFFNIDQCWFEITTDMDYNPRNGINDTYTVYMYVRNNKPVEGSYRKVVPSLV